MAKTTTQAIHDNQQSGETMTACLHRLRDPNETMTHEARDLVEAANHPSNPNPPLPKPAKPTGLTESGVTKTEIKLDWAQTANAAKYTVGITPAITGYPKDVSVTNETFTGLTAATEYTITVKACNATGCSANAEKKVTTAA